jgi:hypothetical protein
MPGVSPVLEQARVAAIWEVSSNYFILILFSLVEVNQAILVVFLYHDTHIKYEKIICVL